MSSPTYKKIKVKLTDAVDLNKNSENQLLGDEEYINGMPTGRVILRGASGSSDKIVILGKDCEKVL